jgi:hypothetical protein
MTTWIVSLALKGSAGSLDIYPEITSRRRFRTLLAHFLLVFGAIPGIYGITHQ